MRHSASHAVGIRPLASGDRTELQNMLDRLSRETIHRRFHMPYPAVPDWMLDHLMDPRGGGSLVATAGDDIVGHAMYAREGRGEAEMAVLVEDGWQSRGIGKLLLANLARAADGRGVDTFTGLALGENRRVLRLVDAVFDGARYVMRDGLYDIRMPLRTLKQEPDSAREARSAA